MIILDKGRLLLDGAPEALVAQHAAGTLERLFTQLTGGAELAYQWCLRWFGRKRLESLMTTAQVMMSILFPLSRPADQVGSTSRGLGFLVAILVASLIAGLAELALKLGWFGYFMLAELALAAFLYFGMRRDMLRLTWSAID